MNTLINVVECRSMKEDKFRLIPSVDKVISHVTIKNYFNVLKKETIIDVVRQYLNGVRANVEKGIAPESYNEIVTSIIANLDSISVQGLKAVINATGVILHTNLGRAPISNEAIQAMGTASHGYNNLEFNIEKGIRGSRHVHIENLLRQLSGAEAGLAVNNNAGAVLLVLSALAKRKEVIVSRGESVEIGGGFRVPDVMRQSGAKLIEVGTTNCTYIHDYKNALSVRTAALLRVHSSNFVIQGFTHSINLAELVAVADDNSIPVIDDLGSGCFLDTTRFGLGPEPKVQESIKAGVHVVCFSGDKLVGGPQAGIIIGKKEYIDIIKRHPLARALRIDKTRLAGLAVTLIHYLKDEALDKIPVWQMISMPINIIENRALKWSTFLNSKAHIVDGFSMIGGGSLPGNTLPTKLLAIEAKSDKKQPNLAHLISQSLRACNPAILVRIEKDHVFLDPRTVMPEEDEFVARSLNGVIESM